MKAAVAFRSVLSKDMRSCYLKPPNVSWGLVFPLAWTGVFSCAPAWGSRAFPRSCPA